jgi:hypothetical protein
VALGFWVRPPICGASLEPDRVLRA